MNKIAITLSAFALLISGCGEDSTISPVEQTDEQGAVELIDGEFSAVITVINDGMSAWLVTDIEGQNASASLNSRNARLILSKGLRYKFINAGGVSHPLDFRDSSGGYLLTQDTISGK